MLKFVLLLLPLAGCSVEKRGPPATDAATELTITRQEGDSVLLTVQAPHAAGIGDEVPISIVVQNNRHRAIDLHLTGRELVFDITVERPDSTIVWQRLDSAAVQQIVQLKTLPPRSAFVLSDRWTATEAGRFIIRAQLPTDTEPLLAEPARIAVR